MTTNDVLRTAVALALGSMIAMPAAYAQDYVDFGDFVEQKLEELALGRFGWDDPLMAPPPWTTLSTATWPPPRSASCSPVASRPDS
jgi:hypothetical protein